MTRFFIQVSTGSRMLLGAQAIKVRISHPSRGNVGLLGIEIQISLGKNFNSQMNFRFNFQETCLQDIQFMTRCFTMHCNEHFSHCKIFTFQFLIYKNSSKYKFENARLKLPCFPSPVLFCPARHAARLQGEVDLGTKNLQRSPFAEF